MTIDDGTVTALYAALADLGPTDARVLAEASGRDVGFVHAWLHAEVAAGRCRFSRQTGTYWLTPEQARALIDPTRPTGARTTTQESTMSGIQTNDFASPDEVRSPDPTVTVEIARLDVGEIGRYTFRPGWRWSEHVRPIVGGTACQVEHLGYVVSGTMGIQASDGTTAEVTAGSVYHIAPGHDGWVIGDEPAVVVEFQGAHTYAKPHGEPAAASVTPR